jgi:hypothetical protein
MRDLVVTTAGIRLAGCAGTARRKWDRLVNAALRRWLRERGEEPGLSTIAGQLCALMWIVPTPMECGIAVDFWSRKVKEALP